MSDENNWMIFQGNGTSHDAIKRLPAIPSWRQFQEGEKKRGKVFIPPPGTKEMVNAALYLRRPLLVTGKPGTGKTSLAFAVAEELGLGEVLYWPIGTRTTLQQGLYRYDAIARVQDAQPQGGDNLKEIGSYIQLGPLGTALLKRDKPRVLLVDEIDKSDIDLPNDLLHVFEEGKFTIPELERIAAKVNPVTVRTAYQDETKTTHQDFTVEINNGIVQCQEFPFVILTSNGERDFPPAFLRRCLRLDMKEPNEDALKQIVEAYLGAEAVVAASDIIKKFHKKRTKESLATDQLLNAIHVITQGQLPEGKTRDDLVEQLLRSLSDR